MEKVLLYLYKDGKHGATQDVTDMTYDEVDDLFRKVLCHFWDDFKIVKEVFSCPGYMATLQ